MAPSTSSSENSRRARRRPKYRNTTRQSSLNNQTTNYDLAPAIQECDTASATSLDYNTQRLPPTSSMGYLSASQVGSRMAGTLNAQVQAQTQQQLRPQPRTPSPLPEYTYDPHYYFEYTQPDPVQTTQYQEEIVLEDESDHEARRNGYQAESTMEDNPPVIIPPVENTSSYPAYPALTTVTTTTTTTSPRRYQHEHTPQLETQQPQISMPATPPYRISTPSSFDYENNYTLSPVVEERTQGDSADERILLGIPRCHQPFDYRRH